MGTYANGLRGAPGLANGLSLTCHVRLQELNSGELVFDPVDSTPLKKVAEARDVANHIVLLASAKVSGHVTGQVLMVEGGMEGRVLYMPADFGLGA